MSCTLTDKVKSKARELGADLVGVGNIERWKSCPILMSPAGLLPSGRSVIVCGLHHIDGMVECGGETSPHDKGSYFYQTHMNNCLDHISYRTALFVEDLGYEAVPITASNIWRYRPYKELTAIFAPDMSNIYAPIAAGLAEMGISGLALTPEYGARNRFVSIVTDAMLAPDPLLPGDTLCDKCLLCVKHCPMDAFRKEVKGEAALEIEGHRYPFRDKNLWRCAWAEHFGLSVDLPVPEKVDEDAIIRAVEQHGLRGGTLGYCLKYCLPRDKRVWDRKYCSGPRRRQNVAPTRPEPALAQQDELLEQMPANGATCVRIVSRVEAEAEGVDIEGLLPDAASFVLAVWPYRLLDLAEGPTGSTNPERAAAYLSQDSVFKMGRSLEDMGYSVAPYFASQERNDVFNKMAVEITGTADIMAVLLATSAVLTPRTLAAAQGKPIARLKDLTKVVTRMAHEDGADLTGVSSVERLEELLPGLRLIFDGEPIYDAVDQSACWLPSVGGAVTERKRRVFGPRDYLNTARSVLVLGLRLPKATVRQCMAPPAEAVGPMAFAEYQSHAELERTAQRLVRALKGWGYAGVIVSDLTGTGSLLANPHQPQPNIFCNRFAAMCAGLGVIGKGGFVLTPEYGPNVRFVSIVTDAPLQQSVLADGDVLRAVCDNGCNRCLNACTVNAFREPVSLSVAGGTITFCPLE